MKNQTCPCGSKKSYINCCKILHDGGKAATALELMRSRYCAYACKKPEYIIRTTHSENPQYNQNKGQWIQQILYFCQNTEFQRLDIHEFIDGSDEAYVSFTAHLRQNQTDVKLNEKSRFLKVNGQWLYRDAVFF